MARTGDTYTNPVTGERAIVRYGLERDPTRLVVDLLVAPYGHAAAEHLHPHLTERFEVLSGTVGLRVGGIEEVAGPGHALLVEPGVRHAWWNAGADRAHVLVELSGDPHLIERFEEMLVTLFGLGHEGRVDSYGMPRALQGAVLAEEYADVIRFASPLSPVQRAFLRPLARLGRARGLRARYPHHRRLVVQRA